MPIPLGSINRVGTSDFPGPTGGTDRFGFRPDRGLSAKSFTANSLESSRARSCCRSALHSTSASVRPVVEGLVEVRRHPRSKLHSQIG